jgi:uncharacterized protein (DUF302 family)
MGHYSRKLDLPFNDVLNKITQTLKLQGFGVISSIDVQDTFKTKLNVAFRNYKILGVCNAQHVYKAISLESHNGCVVAMQCCGAGTRKW